MAFNRMTLFYLEDDRSFDFSVESPVGTALGMITANGDSIVNGATVRWPEPLTSVTLRNVRHRADQTHAMIFGMSLLQDSAGVVYHSIGVNGARYEHYNAARYFSDQVSALAPDLLIISLGTNESVDYPSMRAGIYEEVARLVSVLQEKNPQTGFLLVTPPDAFRERTKVNPGIGVVRDLVLRYAVENGLAFYDQYRAMGGEGAAARWRQESLLSRDGIHFTRDGYAHQGHLFYHAIMKGFNAYVPDRHP